MKTIYEKPQVEIINVENEGVMANSPGGQLPGGYGNGGGIGANSTRSTNTHNSSTRQELEDLINDVLTY
ncbi:hypothetical protein D0T50_12575 [Bacteroides sp. 214]|uniref:hypothetical protein n=1 Tax=Bacteroides sp. 214 TaxID=2302935 RepID=UPI0013D70763|nr:hypothetical protein [Bacteroides sp. 214]NDW13719.1 hypothetical protein [Bacteroides sp. 214]